MNNAISGAVACMVMIGLGSPTAAETILDLEKLEEIAQFKVCNVDGGYQLLAYDQPSENAIGRPWAPEGREVLSIAGGRQYMVATDRFTAVHDRKGITVVGEDGDVQRVDCQDVTWQIWDLLSAASARIRKASQ